MSPSVLRAPNQSPISHRNRVTNRISFRQRAYGFHQDPNKPWQYYLDSGRHELLEIMQHERADQLTYSSESSSSSENSLTPKNLQETLEKLKASQMRLLEESDEDIFTLREYFICPEGITRIPFQDIEFDQQKSSRLSSIFQNNVSITNKSTNKRSCDGRSISPDSSSSSSSSSSRPSKLRSTKPTVEYSATPLNSPSVKR